MEKKAPHDLSKDRQKMLKSDLKEGFSGLKDILHAAIKLIIKLSRSIPKDVPSGSIARYAKGNGDKQNNSLAFINKDANSESSDSLDVSVEISKSNYVKYKDIINNVLYPLLAGISTATLLVAAIKVDPVIDWAKTQNECIKATNIEDGLNDEQLANKVMRCNGGHSY